MSNREFSITKWLLFPPATAALAGGIAYFNVSTFGWRQSVVYLIALGLAVIFSLALVKYSGSHRRPVRVTAFACEALMLATLVFNAAFSLKAQRDLAIAEKSEANQLKGSEIAADREKSEAEKWKAISAMGPQARAAAARAEESKAKAAPHSNANTSQPAPVTVRSVFSEYETVLTLAAILEMIFSVGGAFATYGIAVLKTGVRRMPRGSFTGARGIVRPAALDGLSGASQAERKGYIGFVHSTQPEGQRSPVELPLNHAEETSENFNGVRLRVYGQGSGVRVYDRNQYVAHIRWKDYLPNVVDPERPTQAEIENLLR